MFHVIAVFLTVIFHKVVLQHISGVVRCFIVTLLKIYCNLLVNEF